MVAGRVASDLEREMLMGEGIQAAQLKGARTIEKRMLEWLSCRSWTRILHQPGTSRRPSRVLGVGRSETS